MRSKVRMLGGLRSPSLCRGFGKRHFAFAFNALPSIPSVVKGLVIWVRPDCPHSEEVRQILKKQDLHKVVKFQDITVDKPSVEEVLQVRYKLEQPINLWTEPDLLERDSNVSKQIHEWVTDEDRWNYFKVMTPIVFHATKHQAILCIPADRIQCFLKPDNSDKTTSEMVGSRRHFNFVRGMTAQQRAEMQKNCVVNHDDVSSMKSRSFEEREWHQRGGNYYSSDRDHRQGGSKENQTYGGGYDWSHVDFDGEYNEQENWRVPHNDRDLRGIDFDRELDDGLYDPERYRLGVDDFNDKMDMVSEINQKKRLRREKAEKWFNPLKSGHNR